MDSKIVKRIEQRLEDLGMSAAAASVKAGFSNSYIRDLRRKAGDPKVTNLTKLAAVLEVSVEWLLSGQGDLNVTKNPQISTKSSDSSLSRASDTLPVKGIRVEGVSHAGRFEDISLIEDDESTREYIPALLDPRYPHAQQYALKVSGDSMNRKFMDGSYVICAAWSDVGRELKAGDCVHVERVRYASERETTIKNFAERSGKLWLDPDSTNQNHAPIQLNGDGEDTQVVIKGLVIGTYSRI